MGSNNFDLLGRRALTILTLVSITITIVTLAVSLYFFTLEPLVLVITIMGILLFFLLVVILYLQFCLKKSNQEKTQTKNLLLNKLNLLRKEYAISTENTEKFNAELTRYKAITICLAQPILTDNNNCYSVYKETYQIMNDDLTMIFGLKGYNISSSPIEGIEYKISGGSKIKKKDLNLRVMDLKEGRVVVPKIKVDTNHSKLIFIPKEISPGENFDFEISCKWYKGLLGNYVCLPVDYCIHNIERYEASIQSEKDFQKNWKLLKLEEGKWTDMGSENISYVYRDGKKYPHELRLTMENPDGIFVIDFELEKD